MVGTALTTARPASSWTRVVNAVALIVAAVRGLGSVAGGVNLINTPGLDSGGVSFRTEGVMSLIIAAVLVMSAAGDLRIMRFGPPRGGPRLARHLRLMCFALVIAAGSFFSIRERVSSILPEPFTTGPMPELPIVLLIAASSIGCGGSAVGPCRRLSADATGLHPGARASPASSRRRVGQRTHCGILWWPLCSLVEEADILAESAVDESL